MKLKRSSWVPAWLVVLCQPAGCARASPDRTGQGARHWRADGDPPVCALPAMTSASIMVRNTSRCGIRTSRLLSNRLPERLHLGRWRGRATSRWLARHVEPAKAMAAGLDVRQGIEMTSIEREGARWVLHAGAQRFLAERLVITIPAPQAKALLAASGLATAPALIAALDPVEIAPCLTLMAAFPRMLRAPLSAVWWKPGRWPGSHRTAPSPVVMPA